MNMIMLVQVFVLAVLILFEGLLAFYFTSAKREGALYIFDGLDDSSPMFAFKALLSYYLLFNMLIPMGLVVCSEISKIFVTMFIDYDWEMQS